VPKTVTSKAVAMVVVKKMKLLLLHMKAVGKVKLQPLKRSPLLFLADLYEQFRMFDLPVALLANIRAIKNSFNFLVQCNGVKQHAECKKRNVILQPSSEGRFANDDGSDQTTLGEKQVYCPR